MNKQRFLSWTAVTILWLGMGVGCKKEPPPPDPEPACPKECCDGLDGLTFAARLDGVLLKSVSSSSISLQDPVIDKIPFQEKPKEIYSGLVCPVDRQKIDDFVAELKKDPNVSNRRYKIWGFAYDSGIIPFIPDRIYYFKLVRFERIQ
jgi:hypothetical protein